MNLIYFLLVGAVIGWVAGLIMRGGGSGLLGNILVGVVGAMVGGFLFKLLGITWGGTLGSLGTSLVGAIVLLWVVGLIRGK
ncbi:MAG: GlsB/YeaQ/YmgE family stress response membrane protein [bacterium]|nr:GlsB/YeaQ/YmgE family stress response membrane protein [bacterium]